MQSLTSRLRDLGHTLIVSTSVAAILALAIPAAAQVFVQHNLVSDGAVPADLTDQNLVNAWGLTTGPGRPWWVANNGTGTSTLYDGNTGAKVPLTVAVPGDPTGAVFNGGSGFIVSDGMGHSAPSAFMFASEDGTISGWNPAVPPPPLSTQAFHVVDNSASGAIYKGLAVASTMTGDFLYATNFNAGTVDVFDSAFNPVTLAGAFTDDDLPAGYAPFGIANLGGTLFVTYALQDAFKHDDVAGEGHGFVDAYDTSGHLLHRIASKGKLNSPWGLAMAPATFGKFSNDLLVGNFGDGRIHAFDPKHFDRPSNGRRPGRTLRAPNGQPIMIDGLWSLAFGNGSAAGPTDTLFFTAGPNDEGDGLFGKLTATQQRHEDNDQDDDN
jgi:uncharacterized protein (TIGR03118 family)